MNVKKEPFEVENFKDCYGIFPYLLMKIADELYMQIPIHFLEEGVEIDFEIHKGTQLTNLSKEVMELDRKKQIELLHLKMVGAMKTLFYRIIQDKGVVPRMFLVEGKNRASEIATSNVVFEYSSIPTGGILMTQEYKILGINVDHYTDNVLNENL